MNKKLERLEYEVEIAQRNLKTYQKCLETRNADPAFQTAKRLYSEGWRLEGWCLFLTDTDNEIVLYKHDKEVGYWADGVNRDTDECFDILGLDAAKDEDEDTIEYLCLLSEEAGDVRIR